MKVAIITLFSIAGFIAIYFNFINRDSAQETKLTKVEIAATAGDGSLLVLFAEDYGYFEAEGLDASLTYFASGRSAGESMIEGKNDISVMTDFAFSNLVRNEKKAADFKILSSIAQVDNHKILVGKNSGIHGPKDLRGKKVGVAKGTSAEFFLENFLEENNLNSSEVEIVYQNPGILMNLIAEDKIDAMVIWEPYVFKIRQVLNSDIDVWPVQKNKNFFLLVSRDEWLDENPETADRVLRALMKAEEAVGQNEKGARLFFQWQAGYSRSYLDLAWSNYNFGITLSSELIGALKEYDRWFIEHKKGDKELNYDSFIYFDGLGKLKPEAFN